MKHLIDPGPSRKGWHRLAKVLRCPRLYALSYLVEHRTSDEPPAEPLMKGSLMHIGLAHHYAQKSDLFEDKDIYSPQEAIEVLAQQQPAGHRAAWQRHVPEIQRTLADYQIHWSGEQWKTIAIEHELLVNVFDEERNKSYLYTQRVDAVWQHPMTGKIYFVDHKTAARFTSRTLGGYSMNGQFLGYQMIGERMYKDRWGGVLLNVIEWGKGGGSPTFQQMPINPAPHSVVQFPNAIIRAERTIQDYEKTQPAKWPATHQESACWAYRQCRFYQTCQWGK